MDVAKSTKMPTGEAPRVSQAQSGFHSNLRWRRDWLGMSLSLH